MRYTARDDTVYAFVRDATGSVTLPDVCTTPTTAVTTVAGTVLAWKESPSGIVIELPLEAAGPEPTVLALGRVAARPFRRARA